MPKRLARTSRNNPGTAPTTLPASSIALLGQALREQRERAHLSRTVLAERLRRPTSYIQNYETGEMPLDPIEFLDIAQALGFDPNEFIKSLRGHTDHYPPETPVRPPATAWHLATPPASQPERDPDIDRLLTRPEVESRTGLSKASIYQAIRDGRFPKPFRVSPNAVRWSEREIETWVATLPRSNGDLDLARAQSRKRPVQQ